MTGSRDGNRGTCTTCGWPIVYVQHALWNGAETDVLDAWWSHLEHPLDGHEAKPSC